MILAGIGVDDTPEIVDRMADKVIGLRYFEDPDGRTNLAIADVGGPSWWSASSRSTPTFGAAGGPASRPLLCRTWPNRSSIDSWSGFEAPASRVETGRFGADMAVELVNDGPFTLVLDSERDLGGAD